MMNWKDAGFFPATTPVKLFVNNDDHDDGGGSDYVPMGHVDLKTGEILKNQAFGKAKLGIQV